MLITAGFTRWTTNLRLTHTCDATTHRRRPITTSLRSKRFVDRRPLGIPRRHGYEVRGVAERPNFATRSLGCSAEIAQGSLVWCMEGDIDTMLVATDDACEAAVSAIAPEAPLGFVVFDCSGRRSVLGEAGSAEEVRRISGARRRALRSPASTRSGRSRGPTASTGSITRPSSCWRWGERDRSARRARATQLLAEFLAAVSSLPDAPTALEAAVERAAQALDAEIAAVVSAGRARTSVGFPTERIPHEPLAQVAAGERRTLDIPGAGQGHAIAVPLAWLARRTSRRRPVG